MKSVWKTDISRPETLCRFVSCDEQHCKTHLDTWNYLAPETGLDCLPYTSDILLDLWTYLSMNLLHCSGLCLVMYDFELDFT